MVDTQPARFYQLFQDTSPRGGGGGGWYSGILVTGMCE